MKLIRHLLVVISILIVSIARASDGMWLPLLLEKMNEKEMKSLGMKISAKDIYSVNSGSLKDAIVSFGGFCTGEVISSKGLVLTNHHCGFDAIQNHSSIDHNYIRDGFWSGSYAEEIPNAGLFVTFIVRIEDVTARVLNGVNSDLSESERQSLIDKNSNEVKKSARRESYQDGFVRGFFEGNQYYLFITETYRDIRLVGAPPSAIGNFGRDTDNWVWPRHTGDFSMFRIYAGKDNKPAEYSADNVPYVPKRSLSISLDGTREGDFTMVFGFPGRTTEYLHSAAVNQIMTVNDPAKIAIREKALNVMDNFMRKDENIKIAYAAKYANVQNYYKKWQGEVLGLTRTDAVGKKQSMETVFQQRVNANPAWKSKYGSLLQDLAANYAALQPYALARDYFSEIMPKVEVLSVAAQLTALLTAYEKNGESGYQKRLPVTREALQSLFAEYNPAVDRQLFEQLLPMYAAQPSEYVSATLRSMLLDAGSDYSKLADKLYGPGTLSDSAAVLALIAEPSATVLNTLRDNAMIFLYNDMLATFQLKVAPNLNSIQNQINGLQRIYMAAQMEVMKEKKFYPDANSTLRVAYGNVKSYQPRDAVKYESYTYLDGVMEKYIPGDYEFDVPEKLRTLYRNKDYGRYGENGRMPVCFIATNHTTGGNSGSPALDGYGNLVGLNFDRVWEGTMSDINFDPSICRNIMVDIRYVLFIIDKYAGDKRLVDEMKLVHPKAKKG